MIRRPLTFLAAVMSGVSRFLLRWLISPPFSSRSFISSMCPFAAAWCIPETEQAKQAPLHHLLVFQHTQPVKNSHSALSTAFTSAPHMVFICTVE
jgi:hypothetical protein